MSVANKSDAGPVSFVSASIRNLGCSSGVLVDDVKLIEVLLFFHLQE